MPELRRDIFRDSWVIVATHVELKPKDFPINRSGSKHAIHNSFCPFCEGNESYTPPEVAAFRQEGTQVNSPGWQVRAVPNKFSAFNPEVDYATQTEGLYTCSSGFGKHEVIIETPVHGVELHQFPLEQMAQVFRMMRLRYNTLAEDERLKYIQIYKNRGLFAGASLAHSHSQVMGLPLVPDNRQAVPRYYEEHQVCLMCSTLEEELKKGDRVVWESSHFVLLCPYASRFSYETWVIPRRHTEHFGAINDEEVLDLAECCHRLLNTLLEKLENTSYNLVINTAPVNEPGVEGYHWYMEITPRLIISNGVELGTGYYINPVCPEIAAQVLRSRIGE